MELATAVLLEGRTHALDRWVCTALRVRGNTVSPYTVWASLQNASVLHGLHKDQGDAPALMARDWTWRCRSDPPIRWEGWGRSCGSTPTRELWGQLSPRRSNSSQDLPVALVLPCDPEAPRLTRAGVGGCATASPALLCAPYPSGTTPYAASHSVRARKSHLRECLTNLCHCRTCSYLTYLLYLNIICGQHTYRSWHCCNRELSRSQMNAYATPVYNQFTFLQHFLKITLELNPFFIDLNCSSGSVHHVSSIVSVNAQQCFYTLLHRAAKIISVNKII